MIRSIPTCCDDGNSASPICSPEVRDRAAGVARSTVTWLCMACGSVVGVEDRERRLVTVQPRRRPESVSSPDRGADRHLSGRSWIDRQATRRGGVHR